MADKPKTLYQSELVQLSGEDGVEVLINSDVLPSKFKKGTFFVNMEVNGTDRTYNVENEACAAALSGNEGVRAVIRAFGSREEAGIELLEVLDGEPDAPQGAEPPPPKQQQQRQQQRQRQQARAASKAPPKQPPAKPAASQRQAAPTAQAPKQPTPKQMVVDARARAYRIEQVWLLALERGLHARKFAHQHFDFELSDTMLQSAVGTIAIQMLRDSWHHQMPADGTLSQVILEAIGKAAAKQENGGGQ